MSYRIDLSFKNCKPQDVYKNICEFESLVLKNAKQYIKDNLIYIRVDAEKDRFYNNDQVDKFISYLFRHHIWYCEKISALCIVWDSDVAEINNWFDGHVFFQNSCDQNYDYDTWNFNKTCRRISNRIKKMKPDKFVKEYIGSSEYYNEGDREYILKDVDYHKKSFVYETIEKIIDAIWNSGFEISHVNGRLDNTSFELRNTAIRLLLNKSPNLKECFQRVRDLSDEGGKK